MGFKSLIEDYKETGKTIKKLRKKLKKSVNKGYWGQHLNIKQNFGYLKSI